MPVTSKCKTTPKKGTGFWNCSLFEMHFHHLEECDWQPVPDFFAAHADQNAIKKLRSTAQKKAYLEKRGFRIQKDRANSETLGLFVLWNVSDSGIHNAEFLIIHHPQRNFTVGAISFLMFLLAFRPKANALISQSKVQRAIPLFGGQRDRLGKGQSFFQRLTNLAHHTMYCLSGIYSVISDTSFVSKSSEFPSFTISSLSVF